MTKVGAYWRGLLAIGLMLALLVPMSHGLGEILHSHHVEDGHCHVRSHDCSALALTDACHLSTFHGAKNACKEHQHLTHAELECQLCLWAEPLRHEAAMSSSLHLALFSTQVDVITWYRSASAQESWNSHRLRGPPFIVC